MRNATAAAPTAWPPPLARPAPVPRTPQASSAANMLLIAFGVVVCALGEANLVIKGLVQQLVALLFEVRPRPARRRAAPLLPAPSALGSPPAAERLPLGRPGRPAQRALQLPLAAALPGRCAAAHAPARRPRPPRPPRRPRA